eukprot:jgi/Botrbrau1/12972/Bobra.154_2s0021.1
MYHIISRLAGRRVAPLFNCVQRSNFSDRAIDGLVEIRQYTIEPRGLKSFLELSSEYAELRKGLMPWRGMFVCDTGGIMNQVTHLYHYRDFDHRDAVRRRLNQHQDWQSNYIDASRTIVSLQQSQILVEARNLHDLPGVYSIEEFEAPSKHVPGAPPVVYELTTYKMPVHAVSKTLDYLERSLPPKVQSVAELGGKVVFVGLPVLGATNTIVELWRYPSAQARFKGGAAVAENPVWQEAQNYIPSSLETVEVKSMHPVSFSPWQ